MSVSENYLTSIKSQFQYYKSVGEKTFAQLKEEDFFWQYNDASNSIAVMVHHLSGNMLSRWTHFLTSDGEKEWRQRDKEFEDVLTTRSEILKAWEKGWTCVFEALATIHPSNFNTEVYIRNQAHTIIDAANRQLAHYAYHIGQIVYIGRMMRDSQWESLSIPKGKSKQFNSEKFSKGKHGGHFSDDLK